MERKNEATFEQFNQAVEAVKFWSRLAMMWLATLLLGIGIGWFAAVS
jgi:hypothetical protein